MPRGGNYFSIPNNLYYVRRTFTNLDGSEYEKFWGPYAKRPTAQMAFFSEDAEIIHFKLDENGNYIRKFNEDASEKA